MAYITLSDVLNSARFRTGTSTSDFADTNTGLLGLANKHLRKISLTLIDNNEDWYATITAASLSSGVNAYALTSDSSLSGGGNITLNRLEVTYDNSEWKVATAMDYEQMSTPTALIADINANFSTSDPYYAIYGNSIYLFPVPTADVSGGLRKFEVVRQGEATNSSFFFNMATGSSLYQLPKEFMEPLEDFVTADIYERIGKLQEATATRNAGEARLQQLKEQFSPRNEDFDMNMGTNAYEDYGE